MHGNLHGGHEGNARALQPNMVIITLSRWASSTLGNIPAPLGFCSSRPDELTFAFLPCLQLISGW